MELSIVLLLMIVPASICRTASASDENSAKPDVTDPERNPDVERIWTAADEARVSQIAREADRLWDREEFDGALRKRSEVVQAYSKELGEQHWRTVRARAVYRDFEKYCGLPVQGREELRAALELSSVGHDLLKKKEYSTASTILKQALGKLANTSGVYDSHFVQTLGSLVITERELGNLESAQAIGRQACAINKKIFGGKSPVYAMSLNSRAEIEFCLGSYKAAEASLTDAEEIYRTVEGIGCQPHVYTLCMLALVKLKQGDEDAAEIYARRAYPFISFSTGVPPEDPRAEATHLFGTALILGSSSNPSGAAEMLAHVVQMDDLDSQPTPLRTMAMYYQTYATFLKAIGEEERSARVAETAKAFWREHLRN